jgi:hypothetical protein
MNINEALNNLNFNVLNNAPDDDGIILIAGIVFIVFIFIFLGIVFFINKKRTDDGEDEGGTPTPGGHGGRSPASIQTLANLPPDNGQTDIGAFLSILGPLLLGVAIGLAPELIASAIKRLTASSKTLIKNQLKALRAFKEATRPKFTIRAAARSTKKLLAQKLSRLGIAARVRLGMVWSKALKAAGWTTQRITDTLARRLGEEAAQRVAQESAQKAATRAATAATSIGPLGALDIAFSAVSLGLDLTNTGGWLDIDQRQTSDLLEQRAITETDLKNSFISGFKNDDGVVDPSTAIGFYPLYWGPLDEMPEDVNAEGLDFFDVMVETKMFEMLMADEPDPFIVKLLMNVAKRYGVDSTDIEQLFTASMLTDMTQEDYWGLYDRAFDSICIENGGVLVDTGVSGRPKQCSHASETACHAKSPWTEGQGINATDDENITYTEWRDRDFFNKNYTPASVPAGVAGACIIQDPSRHELCSSEKICRTGAGAAECYKNEYIRNRGICHNKEDLCKNFGVSYCQRMRQRGGSGDPCPTALDGTQADLGDGASILLPGETLPSCYKGTNDKWAEFFLGSVIYRYFKSGQFVRDAEANSQALAQGLATAGTAVAVQAAGSQGDTLQLALTTPPSSGMSSDEAAEKFFVDFGNSFVEAFTTPPPSDECFPGSSLVTLEDSSVIQLRDLKLGMKVLSQCPKTGKPVFSEVFMWLVRHIGIKGSYIKLTTAHGEILKLSSQHYVHVNDTLISAQEVKIGDIVYIHDGQFEPTIVVKIENVIEDDAISPVTVSGNIVVNGVLASCITTYEDIIGSSFPTIYFTKKTPPMMVHHWFFKTIFKYTGYKGVKFVKFLHTPLYLLAGLDNAMSN